MSSGVPGHTAAWRLTAGNTDSAAGSATVSRARSTTSASGCSTRHFASTARTAGTPGSVSSPVRWTSVRVPTWTISQWTAGTAPIVTSRRTAYARSVRAQGASTAAASMATMTLLSRASAK
ncbi:hypothetical protein Asp14428_75720 [Actinoplanes sp. NBRC 14428]|nr:hypothetical protein Asp14428_75720 [Actinoplanes sp. NBRC 14428]